MRSDEEIDERVVKVLRDVFPLSRNVKLTPEISLVSDLGMDSLKVAELSIVLELAFGQSFYLPDWLVSEDDPHNLTIASLLGYLKRNSADGP